jgi:hypothetical protein
MSHTPKKETVLQTARMKQTVNTEYRAAGRRDKDDAKVMW